MIKKVAFIFIALFFVTGCGVTIPDFEFVAYSKHRDRWYTAEYLISRKGFFKISDVEVSNSTDLKARAFCVSTSTLKVFDNYIDTFFPDIPHVGIFSKNNEINQSK